MARLKRSGRRQGKGQGEQSEVKGRAADALVREAGEEIAANLKGERFRRDSSEDDILNAVYRLVYLLQHGAFPADKLTTAKLMKGLGAKFGEGLPDPALGEFFVAIATDESFGARLNQCAWSWAFLNDEGKPRLWARARHPVPGDDSGRRNETAWQSGMVVFGWAQSTGLIDRQVTFGDVKPCKELRNPVMALIRRYLEGRVVVRPETGNDPILPSGVAMLDRADSRLYAPRAVSREDRFAAMFLPAHHKDAGGQLSLGFGGSIPAASPALPLHLYYHSGIHDPADSGGREAPFALRIFVEGILSFPFDRRGADGPERISITRRYLEQMLYGKDGRKPRPNEYYRKVWTAQKVLDDPRAQVPFIDPETGTVKMRRVVSLTDLPGDPENPGRLDDTLTLIVYLPPGAQDGPVVSDREKLRRWGKESAAVYRLKLNLYWRWFFPGQTMHPAGRGERRVWLPSNDPERYGDPISVDELVFPCFPAADCANAATMRVLRHKAKKALSRLVAAGEARKVDAPRGCFRILPPARVRRSQE